MQRMRTASRRWLVRAMSCMQQRRMWQTATGCLGTKPSLQRVDLPAEGADPVLLQNIHSFLGLVHSQDDDGVASLPAASPPDTLTVDGNSCTVWLYNSMEGCEIYGYCHYLHQCPGHICQTLR